MICSHRLLRFRLPLSGALLCALLAGLMPATAFAEDSEGHVYVMPNGRIFDLVKSDTEFAVTFRDAGEVAAASARMEAQGRGKVSDIQGIRHDRIKLLTVTPRTAVLRDFLGADPAIESIRSVYYFEGTDRPVLSTGEIVLKVRDDAEFDSILAEFDLELIEPVEGLKHVYRVRPEDQGSDEVLIAARLATDPRMKWAQPNLRRSTKRRQVTALDEYFDEQWHLDNPGQNDAVEDADIDAPEAWVYSEGQDVLIGMLDDGCDVDHVDLAGNYIGVGQDALLESNDPDYENPRPKRIGDVHGTAVMGTAVARPNTIGGRGVAYLANFTASGGFGEGITDAEIAGAFTFARQQGVDVHINSWGVTGANPAIIVEAIRTAFLEGRDPDGEGDEAARGMVVVFASGNDGLEIDPDEDLSMLPEVLGVGASTDQDVLATYSTYGTGLNFVAPSGDEGRPGILTTDNTDGELPDDGYNRGGIDETTGGPAVDEDGLYTTVSGTSFSCPIAAGVAALVLSINPDLTATNVRILMEHTCDKIDADEADYDGITQKSLTHGYGRINAHAAVVAADEFIDDDGRTWPGRVAAVEVDGDEITFQANIDTNEFLIVQSFSEFDFVPEDDACYACDQSGCSPAGVCRPLSDLPVGATASVLACNGACTPGDEMDFDFNAGVGMTYFAIYARNSLGRYSFGVAVDSNGNVNGDALAIEEEDDDSPTVGDIQPPDVTISASPTAGESPLTVSFAGNATSEVEIDEERVEWDFDTSDAQTIDATKRTTTHVYEVGEGEIRTFTAKLTMYDIDGREGSETVQVRVTGSGAVDSAAGIDSDDLRIVVQLPDSVDSDVDEGQSPFDVQLSLQTDETLNGTVQSVTWDLGDGTTASSRVVPKTFINDGETDIVYVVIARVTVETTGGALVQLDTSRRITVTPGQPEEDSPEPNLPGTETIGDGGNANPLCGALGVIPFMVLMATLTVWRRRGL